MLQWCFLGRLIVVFKLNTVEAETLASLEKFLGGKKLSKFFASGFVVGNIVLVSQGINFHELSEIKYCGSINFRETEIKINNFFFTKKFSTQ